MNDKRKNNRIQSTLYQTDKKQRLENDEGNTNAATNNGNVESFEEEYEDDLSNENSANERGESYRTPAADDIQGRCDSILFIYQLQSQNKIEHCN